MSRLNRMVGALAGAPLVAGLCAALCAALCAGPAPVAAQSPEPSNTDIERGRVHYVASCARCHGMQGDGGEGPPLARAVLPRARDDASLIRIMAGGIPGTGMSESWWLSADELTQLAVYVRSLALAGPDEVAFRGDPVKGREIYESNRCARCHTLGGFGTSRGPDLTTVGLRRGSTFLEEAIVDPGAALPRGQTAMPSEFDDYLMVRVVDAGGNEVRGTRVNEDSYTIQIKDGRGRVRSYSKAALREFEKEFDRSLMRSYADSLTEEEIDDLVAYLMTLQGTRLRGIS